MNIYTQDGKNDVRNQTHLTEFDAAATLCSWTHQRHPAFLVNKHTHTRKHCPGLGLVHNSQYNQLELALSLTKCDLKVELWSCWTFPWNSRSLTVSITNSTHGGLCSSLLSQEYNIKIYIYIYIIASWLQISSSFFFLLLGHFEKQL